MKIAPKQIAIIRDQQQGCLYSGLPAIRTLHAGFQDERIRLVDLPQAVDFEISYPAHLDDLIQNPADTGFSKQSSKNEFYPKFLAALQDDLSDLSVQMQGSSQTENPLVVLSGAVYSSG